MLLIAACAAPRTGAACGDARNSRVPTKAAPTQPPAATDNSWDKVQQAGVLRVGTSADYEPYEYYNDKFQLDGFDIALIKAIGEKLGVKVDLNDYAFDGLPGVVALDQADVAIAALSVTPERQAIADFSNVYFAGSDGVLARPDADAGKIKDTAALAAVRLGVQDKSVYETMAQDKLIDTGIMPKENLFVYSDITRAVSDLKAKRIDAVWLDRPPGGSVGQGRQRQSHRPGPESAVVRHRHEERQHGPARQDQRSIDRAAERRHRGADWCSSISTPGLKTSSRRPRSCPRRLLRSPHPCRRPASTAQPGWPICPSTTRI